MLLSLVGVVGTFVLGLLILLVVYGLLILVLTRESPITFYRKYASCMLLAFTLSSSNATMPTHHQYCVNKLGVSPKVASFAIPLGFDQSTWTAAVSTLPCASLFLAQMYGVDISGGTLLTLAISVMMLAIGAPGVTGRSVHLPFDARGAARHSRGVRDYPYGHRSAAFDAAHDGQYDGRRRRRDRRGKDGEAFRRGDVPQQVPVAWVRMRSALLTWRSGGG